jgi:hypothetical protein
MAVIEDIIKTDTSMNILARKLSRMPNKVSSFIWVDMMHAPLIAQRYTIYGAIFPTS